MTTAEMITPDLSLELFHLRISSKIDRRIIACSVTAERSDNEVLVRGFSMFPQTDAFIRATAEKIFAPDPVSFDLQVLSRDCPLTFQQVVRASAPLYRDSRIEKEDMLTEALYGAVMRTFFEQDGFVFAQHPDGYLGYVPAEALSPTTEENYLRWKNSDYAILRESHSVELPGGTSPFVLPPAARLILHEDGTLELPSGDRIRLEESRYLAVRRGSSAHAETLERHAATFSDTPYLWGGKTQEGIDCSGFMQSLMIQEGIWLPRDASMQAYVGEIVGYLPGYEDLLPGDLVFFMNNTGHIYHVGVYLGDRMYLHSSGSQNIIRSSFEPDGPNYSERYGGTFVFGRRLRP